MGPQCQVGSYKSHWSYKPHPWQHAGLAEPLGVRGRIGANSYENNRFMTGNLIKIGSIPLVLNTLYAIMEVPMAIQKKNAFSRRLPDLVTEELVSVLSQKKSFEFKQLFEVVHENLRQRNAASGGEEMLRLRAYEKLQNLVARGVVKKSGKSYKGDAAALAAMAATNAQAAATVVSKT